MPVILLATKTLAGIQNPFLVSPSVVRTRDPMVWTDIQGDAEFKKRDVDPPSAAALNLERQISDDMVHPVDALQAAIGRNEVTMGVLRVCLQAYVSQLQSVSHPERLDMIKEKPMAAMALEHLWSQVLDWFRTTLNDGAISKWICYLAVLEGLDDIIIDWIKEDLPEQAKATAQDGVELAYWRNGLLRMLVEATLNNTTNQSGDAALRVYFRILDDRKNLFDPESQDYVRRHGQYQKRWEDLNLPEWTKISTWPAACVLISHLGRGAFPKTSAGLYNRFTKHILKHPFKGTPAQHELSIARLSLKHPTKPDAYLACEFFGARLRDKSIEDIKSRLPRVKNTLDMWGAVMREIITLAKQNGQYGDVEWLADLYRSLPILWPLPRGKFAESHRQLMKLIELPKTT
ncbi:hypothetical protein LTR56_014731 [Elasticomyces elasticus]|nr:hypothetical protein LTR56_014731 [Elasticomyces elasticus]KAK3645471.1 hypothetical protein LTR22_014733 [Elasticomyces elasticus]KAK4915827.1 hypothetical protein LTR49_016085 [Elasticomyces elasticus]KAK5755577.1 hypothetical protein LTS12_014333 [Elasticomyces elasticus]